MNKDIQRKIDAVNKLTGMFKVNKYRNKKVTCLSKHSHDSILEADHCNGLLAQKQRNEIMGYRVQERFPLLVKGILICNHVVDFFVYTPFYSEVHDTKGIKTAVWSIKYKLFKALYPEIPYIIIQKQSGGKKWPKVRRGKLKMQIFKKQK